MSQDGQGHAVIVEEAATGRRRIFSEGEAFYGGVLERIERGRVTVAVGEVRYTFELPLGPVEHDPSLTPSRRSRRPRPAIFTPLRPGGLEPYQEGGVVTGALIRKLPPIGSKRLRGFKKGDIIRAVDGQPITTANMVEQLPTRLRQQASTELELERHGQRHAMTYR